ncbi:MAG TPA: adenylate/guanylate cyclase domain-containing protein [Sporichthya sp.]|nr:adenylate/guanylate cyclase domain-containing protein [Sporichthya sp.]
MDEPTSACGHPNRSGARFCSECGTALAVNCPTCGGEPRPGARFCDACGSALTAAVPTPKSGPVPSPEGERKQVTVLFADVARSMELAERLDADEWTQIMARLFEICRAAVESFGGTVDKFTGDGVMALFGAPVAFEDHAWRACHAALRLVADAETFASELTRRDVEFGVRVGLNSGEVIAGAVGDSAYTAVGHTVGLAQRMENLSVPGEVRLTEATAALISGGFLLRDLGRHPVKGSSAAVGVYALVAAVAGPRGAARRRTGSALLVGRHAELATLELALKEAQNGRFQLIGIVGEAGAGKSRLCDELARQAAESGVVVRRSAGVAHATSVPLLPVMGWFRDYFAVADSDSPEQVRAKISSRLLGLDAAFEPDLGLLYDFMEAPDPDRPVARLAPEARRRRVLELIRRVTARRSELTTLVILLEDLHWFDRQSVEFLDAWLPSFPGTRTLILTNFRPEFQPPWSRRSYYRQIPLPPLDSGAVTQMLADLLGPDPSCASVAEQVLDRTGGNPFFIEEIVRSLAGDGTLTGTAGAYRSNRPDVKIRVPPTVQAVLGGRIDRLPSVDKVVLQAAAVIGRTFTETILAAVADLGGDELNDALSSLCAEELLQETESAGEFRFWHPLTQEVAYGTLLASARRRRHIAAATALIDSGPERHDELSAVIATHYEAAAEDLEAARWQLRAGNHSLRSDLNEARRRWQASVSHLQATEHDSRDALELGLRARARLLRFSARVGAEVGEVDRLLAEARPAADRLGDPAVLADLAIATGSARFWAGDAAGANSAYREAIAHADRAGDLALQALARGGLALIAPYVGPVAVGREMCQEIFALCDGDPLMGVARIGFSIHDTAKFIQASVEAQAGRLDAADRLIREVVDLFGERPSPEWECWNLSLAAQVAYGLGEPAQADEAVQASAQCLRLAHDSGNVAAGVQARQAAGLAALIGGDAASAAVAFTTGLAEARAHRCGLQEEASLLAHLASAQHAVGRTVAARLTVDEAVAVAGHQGAAVIECLAHLVRARVWRETATGEADLAEARRSLAAGDALVSVSGARTYAAFLAEERARLDSEGLTAVADAYDAIGATGHAARIRAEVAG